MWASGAAADGTDMPGGRGADLQRGANAPAATSRSVERGVAVWRGPKSVDLDLDGAGAAQAPASEATTIVLDISLRPRRFLRTQGFFSGHPGSSRRFTQGFWSGPVDLGDRPRVVVLRR
jgi:hypothetical protein